MSSINKAFSSVFRSARLVYRAMEDANDSDKTFLYDSIRTDPLNTALASGMLLRPITRKSWTEEWDQVTKDVLLFVLICLSPDEELARRPSGAGAGPPPDKSADDKAAEDERKPPTPIGYILLSSPRSHSRGTMVGLQLAEPFQGRGYGPEAIRWAVDWAFVSAGVHRVEIGAISYNERAVALYEKLGFRPEGRRREVVYQDRRWWDLVEFGMLEGEWEELRKEVAWSGGGRG